MESILRDWVEFTGSLSSLTAEERRALATRSRRRVALVDAREIARAEVESEALPPDLAATLTRERGLSQPFKLIRALEDSDRALGK